MSVAPVRPQSGDREATVDACAQCFDAAIIGGGQITRWVFLDDLVTGLLRVVERAQPGRNYLMTGDAAPLYLDFQFPASGPAARPTLHLAYAGAPTGCAAQFEALERWLASADQPPGNAQQFDTDLMELSVTPLLRTFIAEHRALIKIF